MTEQPKTITIVNSAVIPFMEIGNDANNKPIFNEHPNVNLADAGGTMVLTVIKTDTGDRHTVHLIPPNDTDNYTHVSEITEEHKIQWTRDALELWIQANTAKST
jgi:hypothetical protein